MKVYKGNPGNWVTKVGARVWVEFTAYSTERLVRYPLSLRLDLRNHSPTGFSWGYNGSGPAQLALALLCDVLKNDEHALNLYLQFKAIVVVWLPQDKPWVLTEEEILNTVEEILSNVSEFEGKPS